MKDLKHLYEFEKLLQDVNNDLVKKAKADAFANFIQTMRCVSGQLTEFDEHLWFFTIDIVRVMHDGTMSFVFQNGSEITI